MRKRSMWTVTTDRKTGSWERLGKNQGMNKTKKAIAIIIAVFYLFGHGKQSAIENMDIRTCVTVGFNKEKVLSISVVTNTSRIGNKRACAKQIIQHCINDTFQTVQFDYENHEYPCEIIGTVYLKESDLKDKESVFTLKYYSRDGKMQYNIKEHPERFHLKIRK